MTKPNKNSDFSILRAFYDTVPISFLLLTFISCMKMTLLSKKEQCLNIST